MTLLPELYMLFIFCFLSLPVGGEEKNLPFTAARVLALVGFFVALTCAGARGDLFAGAYQVDFFSQVFKVLLSAGFTLVVFMFEKENEVENLPEFSCFSGFPRWA